MRWRAWIWIPGVAILALALMLLITPGRNDNVGFALLLLAVILGTLGIEHERE